MIQVSDLVEDSLYRIEGKIYLYRGQDMGLKYVFVLADGQGMKVYSKNRTEIEAIKL